MEYCKIKIHSRDYCINNNASVVMNEQFIPQQCSLISKTKINEKLKRNFFYQSIPSLMSCGDTANAEFYESNLLKTNWESTIEMSLRHPESVADYFQYESVKSVSDKFHECRIQPSFCGNSYPKFEISSNELIVLNDTESLHYSKIHGKYQQMVHSELNQKVNCEEVLKSSYSQNIHVPLNNQNQNFSVQYLTYLQTSKKFISGLLSNLIEIHVDRTLSELITKIISKDKAHQIKILLNNLLKDIEKSKSQTKYSNLKNEIKVIVKKSPSNCPKRQMKIPSEIDFQKAKSISDIIKLCSNISIGEKKHCEKNKENLRNQMRNSGKANTQHIVKSSDLCEFVKLKQTLPYNRSPDPNNLQKVFALSPFDEIIKSHTCPNDRRLRAVANKMRCKIEIFGPMKVSHFTPSFYTTREKIIYHCVLSGDSKYNLEKCLKCIKDTFPTTTIRDISLP